MSDELWRRSACDLAEGIARRRFSCREVMEAVVGRIRAKNGALNAIVFDCTEEALANYLGLPAGVVPAGLVEGLPAGVQIVGRRFREDLILDAMAAVEAQVGVLAHTLWAREQ